MQVKDILQFGGLADAHVVAGRNGLEKPITSISVLEVAEAEIKNWALTNQLYLSSFYAITHNTNKQLEVITALHENHCCGLIICHFDLFLKCLDQSVLTYCDEHNFPLIIANSEKSYIEIMYPIVSRLINTKNTKIEYLNLMQNRLIELIATKKDVNFIYKSMEIEYGGALIFFDTDKKLIYPKNNDIQNKIQSFMDSHIFDFSYHIKTENRSVSINDQNFIIYPIEYRGWNFGFILAEFSIRFSEENLLKLSYIANLASLISTKRYRLCEIEKKRKQEYISDLLTWNFRSNDVAEMMGKAVGWDISNKSRVLIININDIQVNLSTDKDFTWYLEEVLYKQIKDIVKQDNPKNLVGLRSDIFIILLEDRRSDELQSVLHLCKKLLDCCNHSYKGSVSIGLSRPMTQAREIPEAYQDAMDAMRFGRFFFGDQHISVSDWLGFYSLLSDIKKLKNFDGIKRDIFSALQQYDEAEKSCLMLTLKTLILHHMDVQSTAEAMFVHRNTINYRKRKITEILGYTPWEMPYLFNTMLVFVSDIFEE